MRMVLEDGGVVVSVCASLSVALASLLRFCSAAVCSHEEPRENGEFPGISDKDD